MNNFFARTVFIEGPDCSGKTTMIDRLHKSTNYKWHLFDRSQVSRSIFSNLYGRKIASADIHEREELLDINNLFVFLMPPWEIIRIRFLSRGDNLHDVHSLKIVYDEFRLKVEDIKNMPNVLIVTTPSDKPGVLDDIKSWIESREKRTISDISSDVFKCAKAQKNEEAIRLKFSIHDDGTFAESSASILDDKEESSYYKRILLEIDEKIYDEFAGKNEYSKPQDVFSRRFIHTEDTCLSMIHALYREGTLEVDFIFRSTNVSSTFHSDIQFCNYISKTIYDRLGLSKKENYCISRFILNSAHTVW